MDKTKLTQVLDRLVSQAAANENQLDIAAVMDAFAGSPVTPEEMEEVYSRLEKRGIKIQADEGGKPFMKRTTASSWRMTRKKAFRTM